MADTDGTATIEFVLVLPMVLFLALLMVQTMLVMTGNLFVQYAAFTATRSAITQIPIDYGSQNGLVANEFANMPGLPKYEAIRTAAVYAVVPVCGKLGAVDDDPTGFGNSLRSYFDAYGIDHPNWLYRRAAQQLRYAMANTHVQVVETVVTDPNHVAFKDLDNPHRFTTKAPITVRVQHNLNLTVPLAGAIFADGRHALGRGRGLYTSITARTTLNNEGIDQTPPPLPKLPRIP